LTEQIGFVYVRAYKTTKLVQASTIACSSSAMLEQHRSTRLSRLARHVERVESCRDVTWRAKWNLGYTAIVLVTYSGRLIFLLYPRQWNTFVACVNHFGIYATPCDELVICPWSYIHSYSFIEVFNKQILKSCQRII